MENQEIRLGCMDDDPDIYYDDTSDTYWKQDEKNPGKLKEFENYDCSSPTGRYGIVTGIGNYREIQDGVIYIKVS